MRGASPITVTVPVARIGIIQVLQVQVGLVLTALACWLTALLVLLAAPHAEANQVFALLFLVSALGIVGLHHQFENDVGRVYVAYTIILSMPLIGAILFHLALLIPVPLSGGRWRRFALYPLALLALALHEDSVIGLVGDHPWRSEFAQAANIMSGTLMVLGLAGFIIRMTRAAGHMRTQRAMRQARLLLVSWGLGLTPLLLAAAIFLTTNRMPAGTSMQTALFFLPSVLTGTAFAMLRYQAFDYRGPILQTITALFVSVAMACGALLILLPYRAIRYRGRARRGGAGERRAPAPPERRRLRGVFCG